MTGIPVAPGELVDIGYLNEVARAHYRKVTSKQVLNSVAETDLLNGEVTIGAGAMAANRAVRLTARGDWVNNSGAARDVPRFRLKLGSAVLIDTTVTGATVAAASAARQPWRIDATIQNLTTGTQWCHLEGRIIFALGAAVGAAVPLTGEGITMTGLETITTGARHVDLEAALGSAVDTTVAQGLLLTVINPTATATCDVTLAHALVELV